MASLVILNTSQKIAPTAYPEITKQMQSKQIKVVRFFKYTNNLSDGDS